MSNRIGNVDAQSLRGFLKMVEADHPEEFLRIKEKVDPNFDMTSIVFELDRVGKNPVIVLEKVAGFDIPIVTNVAANRRLLASGARTSSAGPLTGAAAAGRSCVSGARRSASGRR